MTHSIPSHGRAWWTVPGLDGGVLDFRKQPIPKPTPGHVLIRIHAAGVNRGELIGRPRQRLDNPAARPAPSGIEFAGVVAALGQGVNDWAVGDRVMGRGTGCHADYTLVHARALWSIPESLSFAKAAALPNVLVTAHDAVVTHGHVAPGAVVLITAGSSGVGTAALQIARWLGASAILTTTRSPQKSSTLFELGATDVIDTTQDYWPDIVRQRHSEGVQVVIDQVGGALFPGLLQVMALCGRYVSVGRNDGSRAALDLDLVALKRLHLIGVTFRTRSLEEALRCSERCAADLSDAIAQGALRPVLDRTFPLEALPEAHAYMLTNQHIGKLVLRTDETV